MGRLLLLLLYFACCGEARRLQESAERQPLQGGSESEVSGSSRELSQFLLTMSRFPVRHRSNGALARGGVSRLELSQPGKSEQPANVAVHDLQMKHEADAKNLRHIDEELYEEEDIDEEMAWLANDMASEMEGVILQTGNATTANAPSGRSLDDDMYFHDDLAERAPKSFFNVDKVHDEDHHRKELLKELIMLKTMKKELHEKDFKDIFDWKVTGARYGDTAEVNDF